MQNRWMRWMGLAALCVGGSLHAGAIEELFSTLWKTEKQVPPTINVLIVHDQPGVVLEVKGKYKVFDPHANAYISTRFIGKRKFIQPISDGLKWGEEFPGIHQIKIVPDDAKTTTLIDGVEYKGVVYVYDIGGSISVVNEIPLEEYLRVLLIPQFEDKMPKEVAAAIAITARTNAWYQIQNSATPFWTVEAAKVGYQGSAAGAHENGIASAIAETRNMILTKNGTAFPSEWGSSAGGVITQSKPVFSRITLFEAENLAKKGDHAAQILNQAFPESTITLIEKTNS